MRPLSELDHYEVLEVRRGASDEEIERAFRIARATYTPGSIATYSVLDDADSAALIDRIDEAYRVLSEAETRHAYDNTLAERIGNREEGTPAEPHPELPIEFEAEELGPESGSSDPAVIAAFDSLDSEEGDGFDGPRLRRGRLLRGIDLEAIAGITKINPTYLRFLEEERYEDLPAAVYVRGFVFAYAQAVGLDANEAAHGYMERYRASPPERRPNRR